MFDTIIIGPTKVGKTTLIASLQQAANITSLHTEGLEIDVLAKNELTRRIFLKALDVVKTGEVPFAGTSVAEAYDFTMSVDVEKSGFAGLWSSIFKGNQHQGHFQFLDSPGGAVFDDGLGSSSEVRAANPHFQAVVRLMLEAEGLIVCVNACDSTTADEARLKEIRDFYTKSFQFLLTHGFETSVPIERVCFVLTKSDLWAEQEGRGADAAEFLAAQDPITIVEKVIGIKSLDTLAVFLESKVEIAFGFTSVYGFEEGAVHSGIGKGTTDFSIDIDNWQPYNIAESFAWLISGEVFNDSLKVLSHAQLTDRVKG
jgi:hypothetical protein